MGYKYTIYTRIDIHFRAQNMSRSQNKKPENKWLIQNNYLKKKWKDGKQRASSTSLQFINLIN